MVSSRRHHVGGTRHAGRFENELLRGGRFKKPQKARTQAVGKRAANAAVVERLDLRFARENEAVEVHFAEFVLQYAREALAPVQEIEPRCDEGGFARAEKARDDVHDRARLFPSRRDVTKRHVGKRPPRERRRRGTDGEGFPHGKFRADGIGLGFAPNDAKRGRFLRRPDETGRSAENGAGAFDKKGEARLQHP